MESVPLKSRGPHYPNTVVVLVTLHKGFREKAEKLIRDLQFEVRVEEDAYAAIKAVQLDLELNPVILVTDYNIDPELRAYNGVTLIQHFKGRKIFPIAPYFVNDHYDDFLFAQAKEAGAEVCFSRAAILGACEDYFRKSILGAKELLRLQHAESLDKLTSDLNNDTYVYNKEGALARFEHTWRKARESNKVRKTGLLPSCIAVDLIKFSRANEETHDDGDRLIKEVASRLCHGIKPTDYLWRKGGDEFFIWLHETKEWNAKRIPKRLNEKLSSIHFTLSSGKPLPVSFRYGVVIANIGDLDLSAEELFTRMWKEANSIERTKRSKQALSA